jgi:hypothetical protein
VKKLPKAVSSTNGEADGEKPQQQKQFQQQRMSKSQPVVEKQPGQQQQLQQPGVTR